MIWTSDMGEEIYNFIFKNSCFEEFFERNIHVYAIQILTKSYEKDENTSKLVAEKNLKAWWDK